MPGRRTTPAHHRIRLLLRWAGICMLALLAATHAIATSVDGGQSRPQSVPGSRYAERVGVISIRGPIDPMTLTTVQRRLERAVKDGCNGVVLELDTPGGDAGATLAICHLLKTSPPTNKVAWIHPQAFSAGAIIALTCREIVVSDASSIGDAAPIAIMPGGGLQPLPVTERAKIEAPILSEVTDSALRNGYDVRLVRAFIRVADELWLVERDDGKRLFADANEYEILFGGPPPRGAATRFVPDAPPITTAEEPNGDVSIPNTTDDDALERFVRDARVTESERGRWKLLGQVDGADELVTLRGEEAVRYGFAVARINTDDELLAHFGAKSLVRYDESWSEYLVRFLISWPVRGLLIVVTLLCFFIEMITPGVGAFGAVAAGALLLLIGAPALAGLAQWWEIMLIVIGFGLIALELLVVPGFGVAGVLGALCLLVGLVFSFVGGDLRTPRAQNDLLIGFFAVLGAFALSLIGIGIVMRRMHTSPFFRKFVLERAVGDASQVAMVGFGTALPDVGVIGIATTDLRPSGKIRIDDGVFDARTSGAWIARGSQIRVVGRDGLGLIVEGGIA